MYILGNVIFSTKYKIHLPTKYTINNTILVTTNTQRDLAVMASPDLYWSDHIGAKYRSAYFPLNLNRRDFPEL